MISWYSGGSAARRATNIDMKEADKQIIRRLNEIYDAQSSGGGVTEVSGTAPIASSGGATPAISIAAATTSDPGSMSAVDKTKLDSVPADTQSEAQVQAIADAKVESEAYGPDWNGDTTHAPAKNDVYDKIEAVVASIPPAHSGGVIGTGWFTIATGAIDAQSNDGVIGDALYSATGEYTVNFSVAQADTNYIAHANAESDVAVSVSIPFATKTVNDFKIIVLRGSDSGPREASYVQVTVERLSQ